MLARPEMQTPAWLEASAAAENGTEGPTNYRNTCPSSTEITAAKAVSCLSKAAGALVQGVYWLDDAGLECDALNYLASDATTLEALWAGRRVPGFEQVPGYVTAAAIEWRRQAGRRY